MTSTALNAARRNADLSALADGAPIDVVVIGGGIIGLEMATVYSTLGTRIDVVEMLDGLIVSDSRAAPGAGRMLPRFGCHHKPPQAHTRGHGFSNITAVPAIPQGHSLGNGCHICVRN